MARKRNRANGETDPIETDQESGDGAPEQQTETGETEEGADESGASAEAPVEAEPAEVDEEAPIEAIEETNRCMVVTRRPMQVGDERCQAGTVIGFISTTPGTHTPEFVAHCIARGVVQVIPVGE